ncbi:hypothetical protein IEQ34_015815 [Dendrobium chrysotoxum]|uniref:Uncharacterized protein n=1 Tax=Dendrobium chrysotoxum TaxID=161865 RepID=A0AAV7GJI4_DENCH|nr:hypothetical protein IEQ34_015815 [Dendrobium chrysotoxum]
MSEIMSDKDLHNGSVPQFRVTVSASDVAISIKRAKAVELESKFGIHVWVRSACARLIVKPEYNREASSHADGVRTREGDEVGDR